MANIFKTSIGKKVVMSISGLFLILFVTLHASLNCAFLFGEGAFDGVCEFMALPIVTIMTPILALGFIFHVIYAFVLYVQDYKARGRIRYEVATKTKTDGWASKNMIVLGIIVIVGLLLHLTHFWANMQLQDLLGNENHPTGSDLIVKTFGCIWIYALYIIWFVALWFHLNHGFWSAFQTIGFNNDKWLIRLKVIGICYSTLLVLAFIIVATYGMLAAHGVVTPAF